MTGLYLVLAAGRGKRMGGAKAMVEVEGETLLSHHVHAAQLARLSGPVCVTGAEADMVETEHGAFPIRFVRNPDPDAPMMSSVRLALDAVPRSNAAFLTPVDVMPARLDTFDLLAEAIERHASGVVAVRPMMRGQGGHPLVLLPEAIAEILADPGVERLDIWMREAHAAGRVEDVEVDDYNVLSNFNHAEDLPKR